MVLEFIVNGAKWIKVFGSMRIPLLTPTPRALENVEYPVIEPVTEGGERPFWSVIIPTYNRPHYLEQTLQSVLDQGIGPDEMQIEVVDNCSTVGDTESIVQKLGGDRVGFYRQSQTLSANLNGMTCLQRARGWWVHVMHDDDLLLPGFYAEYRKFIEAHPEVGMVSCAAVTIDERNEWRGVNMAPRPPYDGIVENAAHEIAKGCVLIAPTAVIARRIWEQIGGLDPNLMYAADWDLWSRIAAVAPIGYIRRPLLLYRDHHSGSQTTKMLMNGRRGEEVLRTIETNVRRLPAAIRDIARRDAYRREARSVQYYRALLHGQGRHDMALRCAIRAFRLDATPTTLRRLIISALRAGRSKTASGGR